MILEESVLTGPSTLNQMLSPLLGRKTDSTAAGADAEGALDLPKVPPRRTLRGASDGRSITLDELAWADTLAVLSLSPAGSTRRAPSKRRCQ